LGRGGRGGLDGAFDEVFVDHVAEFSGEV
jgi:hypothetical protein